MSRFWSSSKPSGEPTSVSSREAKDAPECPICLEKVRKSSRLRALLFGPSTVTTACGHTYCRPCHARLDVCAMCRAPVREPARPRAQPEQSAQPARPLPASDDDGSLFRNYVIVHSRPEALGRPSEPDDDWRLGYALELSRRRVEADTRMYEARVHEARMQLRQPMRCCCCFTMPRRF